jgi:hypothetical protein
VTAELSVNVERANEVGIKILNNMKGSSVSGKTFKNSDKVVTLASKSSTKGQGENIALQPELLLHRGTIKSI